MTRRLLMLWLATVSPIPAQLAIFNVVNNEERALSGLLAMGNTATGEPLDALIRVRNSGENLAIVTTLSMSGAGFTLFRAPRVPIGIVGGFSLDFFVRFVAETAQPDARANLHINNITISLLATATAVPNLFLLEDDGSRTRKLSGDSSQFGTIERNGRTTRTFALENPLDTAMNIASLSTTGDAFALSTAVATPLQLAPRQIRNIEVAFQPKTSGISTGALVIDQRRYVLEGAAKDPPTPKPLLVVPSEVQQSGKQVRVGVRFDSAARAEGAGRVRIEFAPQFLGPDDPGVLFSSTNSRSVAFVIRTGESQGFFSGNQVETLLQTGTTAGTLRVIAEMGGFSAESTYVIAPAPVVMDTLTVTRGIRALEVTLRGFDNSRSASEVAFTFYDSLGRTVNPGQIRSDVSAHFRKYFETPPAGGMFALFASFPATGDTTIITAAEIEFRNGVGSSRTERLKF